MYTGIIIGHPKKRASVSENPLSFNYPYSNEPNLYGDGSAGWVEENVLSALRPTTGDVRINALVDFFTLNGNNKWGNTSRFTDTLGGSAYANDIVQDHFSGFEIYRILQSALNFTDHLAAALGTDYGGTNSTGGITDWLPIYIDILEDLIDESQVLGFNYSPINLGNISIGSSTTQSFNTALRRSAQAQGGVIYVQAKTATEGYLFCRPIDL